MERLGPTSGCGIHDCDEGGRVSILLIVNTRSLT
jgi:hypothetical protein